MKKFIYFFMMLFSCILLISGCSNTSHDENKDKDKSKLEISSTDDSNNTDEDSSVTATIYVSDFESESIVDKEVKLKEVTANTIFDELKNEDIVVSDANVKDFTKYESPDNKTIGVLNLSEEFYNFNLGAGFESMMLNSIAKTYIENFDLDKFKILVEGEEYESGHILVEKDQYFTKDSIE